MERNGNVPFFSIGQRTRSLQRHAQQPAFKTAMNPRVHCSTWPCSSDTSTVTYKLSADPSSSPPTSPSQPQHTAHDRSRRPHMETAPLQIWRKRCQQRIMQYIYYMFLFQHVGCSEGRVHAHATDWDVVRGGCTHTLRLVHAHGAPRPARRTDGLKPSRRAPR